MPFKHRYFYKRRSKVTRQKPKRDWSDYNKKMKMRGDITIWLSPDVIDQVDSGSGLTNRLVI